MTKFAHPFPTAPETHPLGPHSFDRLKRFEGHMDTVALVTVLLASLVMAAAMLAPGNLVPW